MLTKLSFISLAILGFSNDSCAITWHQWQVEYPTERNTGLFSLFASEKASSDQGHHSTGLAWC